MTERTIRRDIARLRDLGYPIDTTRGPESGYSLAPDAALPTITASPGEATAYTLALQQWPQPRSDGAATSMRLKIRSVLPRQAQQISDAVASSSAQWNPTELAPTATQAPDPATIGIVARACAARRQLEITYHGRDDLRTTRTVEPHSIINAAGRWYLIAFDLRRLDWRTFRLDRIVAHRASEHLTQPRPLPSPDLERWFVRQVAAGWQQVTATVRIFQSAPAARRWIAPAWGTITAESADVCVAEVGADSYDAIARWLMLLDAELEVIEPAELAEALQRVSARAAHAASAGREQVDVSRGSAATG